MQDNTFTQVGKSDERISPRTNNIIQEPGSLTTRASGRRRALSTQSKHPQEASALLTLPREVRDQILRLTLAGRLIILSRGWTGNLIHQVQRLESGLSYCPPSSESYNYPSPRAEQNNVLSPALTCRQMYAECIIFLYSQNWFHPGDSYLLDRISRCITPQRLNNIQYLRLHWQRCSQFARPPSPCPDCFERGLGNWDTDCRVRNIDYWNWMRTWEILAGIESLKMLRLEFFISVDKEEDRWTPESFEIVKTVTRPRKIQIVLQTSWYLYLQVWGCLSAGNIEFVDDAEFERKDYQV